MLRPQERTSTFVADAQGVVDGFHLHLFVDLDGTRSIDTLDKLTSWSTTYVRLSDGADANTRPNPPVNQGDAILVTTRVDFHEERPKYAVKLQVARADGTANVVGAFEWDGCGS